MIVALDDELARLYVCLVMFSFKQYNGNPIITFRDWPELAQKVGFRASNGLTTVTAGGKVKRLASSRLLVHRTSGQVYDRDKTRDRPDTARQVELMPTLPYLGLECLLAEPVVKGEHVLSAWSFEPGLFGALMSLQQLNAAGITVSVDDRPTKGKRLVTARLAA